MPTRPDLRPVSRPVEPPLDDLDHIDYRAHLDYLDHLDDPVAFRRPRDEPAVRHDGLGTLLVVVTLFVVLAALCLVAVG